MTVGIQSRLYTVTQTIIFFKSGIKISSQKRKSGILARRNGFDHVSQRKERYCPRFHSTGEIDICPIFYSKVNVRIRNNYFGSILTTFGLRAVFLETNHHREIYLAQIRVTLCMYLYIKILFRFESNRIKYID